MLQVDKKFDQAVRSVSAPRFAAAFIGLGTLTAVGASVTSSPLVVLASGIVFIFILALLWRPGEHPILLVPALLQFIEIALKPLATAITGTSLQDFAEFDANLEPAALFGLVGLAALVLGQRIGAGQEATQAKQAAIEDWPFRRILALALAAIFVGHALDMVAVGGARQIVLALSGIKWAGLFVVAYSTLRLRRGLGWLAVIVVFELVLGMSGFFSDFRLVLFVLMGAAMAAQRKLHARGMVLLAMGAVMGLLLAVFWSEVKKDYRNFLNEGTGAQVVLQPLDERLAYLANQAAEFDAQKLANGFQLLFERLSYIDFLAATMERVPEVLPHEGGAHLGQAIWHILTPRILFPDKPEVPNDTEVTAYYTGIPVVKGASENTSISIGYLGELYIDFGVAGALLTAFLIGLVFGRCYRAIRDYPRSPVFINYGLCMMIALGFTSFGTALIKLVGGLVVLLAAALVLQRLVWPVLLSSGYVRTSAARSVGQGTKA
jgi:hypothetical protein